MASLVATSVVAERKLFASFIAWAMPGPVADPVAAVAQTRRAPVDVRTRIVGGGVHHRERAARAPATPPDTGAST